MSTSILHRLHACVIPLLTIALPACERQDAVLAPEPTLSLTAASPTSVVTEPEGDVLLPKPLARAYQDIVRAEITKDDGVFVLTMTMAGDIPEAPGLAPPGAAALEWRWGLNTDPSTFPPGFPNAPTHGAPAEYMVHVLWDGTTFFAEVIDRTPLLAGGDAIVSPISEFTIEGAELRVSVDGDVVGDPSTFLWVALTMAWAGPLGTNGWHNVDFAPSVDLGEPQASWP